jgi:signal transduction histidine kinase
VIAAVRRWLQPSLVRRLVLAQMATVTLLWVALVGYAATQASFDAAEDDLELMRAGAQIVLPLAAALQTQPELLYQTLQRLDDFQRANGAPEAAREVVQMPRIYLWREGQLFYRSSDASADLWIEANGSLVNLTLNNLPWRAYAQDSADKQWRFAALAPANPAAAGLTPWSRAWVVAPLLFSLPLLFIPAWWSVRVALRPWLRVSDEISGRGPADLSPLKFAPPHRELSTLTSAVNQLFRRLQLARDRERSFIADAAHELRTPIAAMQVNAEAVLGRQLGPLDLQDRELLEGMVRSSGRAGHLVSQLLALTRSDAALDLSMPAEIDLDAVVQDALAQWATLAKGKDIELSLVSDPRVDVRGDKESLRLLVDNLVGNAVKYSPPGASVQVCLRRHTDTVQLEVIDQGPGIAAEWRTRVFDRFYRVPGTTQAGSGLGLAIAKAVADQHGAILELTDGPEAKGLKVVFRMRASSL